MNNEKLIVNFIIGGLIVMIVNYLTINESPLAGALFWSFPLSIIPTVYYLHKGNKSNTYISKFLLSTTYTLIILFITTLSMSYFYSKSSDIFSPLLYSFLVWAIISLIFYYTVITFDLKKYFM